MQPPQKNAFIIRWKIRHSQYTCSRYLESSSYEWRGEGDLKKNFEQSPYSVNVEMEHQTQLRCIPPQGIPPPKVYWLKNGAVLEPDSNIIISSEGHLIFSEARFQDTANYTCVAENLANKRFSDSALLKVIGRECLLKKKKFAISFKKQKHVPKKNI
ncbi:netrin receptor unc5, putative [Pediculus humanus corporis]|uniref:Netrin receptor unc5, putative n=1 Tax=Pediculus humanus subsp. corporis TaxID=121224 RepID=E0VKW0_PEDHC|nr:netrin receptor unc5, putative [Pediculus humanus corporis]EEB14016.1 netrin receptor unc5, putative [Pediculus humanus corporis]